MSTQVAADLREFLNQLDQAHATGARGQVWSFDALVALKRLGLDHEPAELIVAAVNALPKLTAALRAVLDLHVPDQDVEACSSCWTTLDQAGTCPTVRAIAAALSLAQPQSGDRP